LVGSVLGERVVRKEDPKLLTSGGVYLDDVVDDRLAGAAYVVYARSHIAHGLIESINASEAREMPGVVGVFTADDLALEPVVSKFSPNVARTLLASDRVRWVGEPVVAVVAETYEQATDAAQTIEIDIDPLLALTNVEQALASDVHIYPAVGSNAVHDSTAMGGSVNSGPEYFAECEVVVTQTILNQRVAPCPLEPRAAAAAWHDGQLDVWLSTQAPQGALGPIASAAGLEQDNVRIMTPDVGGAFGAKIGAYSEELLVGRLARELKRPVRFRETRSESMMNLGHGRSQLQHITVGGTKAGKVTHLRLELLQEAGGFCELGTILGALHTGAMAPSVYDISNVESHSTSVSTNTNPITPYRGAGRPEAIAAAERAMDLFALEIGMDPVEVRRINLLPKFDEPHTNCMGRTYDCGDYEESLDRALAQAGYAELRREQQRRIDDGSPTLLGIGVAMYVEITGGVAPFGEAAKIEIGSDGSGTIFTGIPPNGQGHDTSWSMIASEQTGIDMGDFELVFGDTDRTPYGLGNMASRSLQQAGLAVRDAAVGVTNRAKQVAARMLEADTADIVVDTARGSFHVAGAPAVARTWADVAAAAEPGELTEDVMFIAPGPTYPFGCHVAVVEVDIDTGDVTHLRHIACDDAGVMLNPMLVEGQVHGGVAQGAAQALWEEVRYDDDGNPVTSNLADYSMISIDLLPQIERVPMETPTPYNVLGAKGIGEAGTIGSTPAVHSAVIDAVAHLGVRHIDMPCTAEKVWSAMQLASK
jgi:carbon-monoxide dehydrogenase large subunit